MVYLVSPFTEGAESGCLLGLGADFKEQNRRAAAYVDQILRGIAPGDLPVEQMSKYGLFINLRTAKVLGITIPPSLLARADEGDRVSFWTAGRLRRCICSGPFLALSHSAGKPPRPCLLLRGQRTRI